MTDLNMPDLPEEPHKPGGNAPFWSPILVFLLGAVVAALNWWRMGQRRKAVVFLGISVVISLFQEWLRVSSPYTGTTASFGNLICLPLAASATFTLTLALIMAYDIRAFKRSGRQPVHVHWTIIFIFLLLTVAASLGILFGADYLGRTTRYCQFPRLQDLIYDNDLRNRTGLQTAFVNHYDMGCDFRWDYENSSWGPQQESSFKIIQVTVTPPSGDSNQTSEKTQRGDQTNTPISAEHYDMKGWQKDHPGSFISIEQSVDRYQGYVTQAMVEDQFGITYKADAPIELPIASPTHANYYRYNCFPTAHGFSDCYIALGYKHILSWLRISQKGPFNRPFEQTVAMIIDVVDNRIYQFETGLP